MGSKKLKLVSLLETVDQVFRRVDEGGQEERIDEVFDS